MPFTKQELEVLHLLAQGKKESEIADELHLAPSTVKSYKQRITFKLKGTGIELSQLAGLSPELLAEWAANKDEKKEDG